MLNIHQTLMNHFGRDELSHYLRLPVGTRSENARVRAEIKTHWIRPGTPECYITDSMTGLTWSAIMIKRAFSSATQVMKKEVVMFPVIDKEKTGRQIRALMTMRGLSVQDVRAFLSLGCVQSVYHWLDGQSLPTLDNLYGLSELLQVPLDMLVIGDRRYHPKDNVNPGTERLLRYYMMLQDCMAA